MTISRHWTTSDLRRMKEALKSGVVRREIAVRFRCSVHTIESLAAKHGWKAPVIKRHSMLRPPAPPPSKRGSFFLRPTNAPAFEPKEGGCAVRVLQGAEFNHWKSVYEARDQTEKAKARA